MIDPAARERLAEWGGPEMVQQMYQIFLDTSDERVDQMRDGIRSGSLVEVERGAHSLKSSANHVGATELERLTIELETLAQEGRADLLPSKWPGFESTYRKTREALEAFLR